MQEEAQGSGYIDDFMGACFSVPEGGMVGRSPFLCLQISRLTSGHWVGFGRVFRFFG
jgi:hypothetical protein